MRRLFVLLIVSLGLALPGLASAQARKLETAVLAGGCFWCTENDLRSIPGVMAVMSGYTGGHTPAPDYDEVSTGSTGHYEAVRVTFDPAKITYAQLLDRFWPNIDPTDNRGQFCDRGSQYRPAIFATPAQKAVAEASRTKWAARLKSGKMVTPILPAARFHDAEEYHRDYAIRQAGAYKAYRQGCGRDARLVRVWGRAPGL
jgi:peptide-methionine (S)-S-oxide reductase